MRQFQTSTIPRETVPVDIKDFLKVIEKDTAEGYWFLIAPDGRVWKNTNPQILAAALLAYLGGTF
jgi:hypothetical protein